MKSKVLVGLILQGVMWLHTETPTSEALGGRTGIQVGI